MKIGLDQIRKDADAALPIELKKLDDNSDYFECPLCGEGHIEHYNAVIYESAYAASVHVYGIGDSLIAVENHFQNMSPANTLKILDLLERASKLMPHIFDEDMPLVELAAEGWLRDYKSMKGGSDE